jgi:hypothetical protein
VTRRRIAAAGGAVLILATFLAYSLDRHPMVAGANSAAPLFGALRLPSGGVRCQYVARVPAKANRVRPVATAVSGTSRVLRVKLVDQRGVIAKGIKKDLHRGTNAITLNRVTRTAHRAGICFSNGGDGLIVLAGENKRVRGRQKGAPGKKAGVASVVFLRPHVSTWGSRRAVIADRFDNSQPGVLGAWSLWLAVLLVAGAAGLAFWWLVFRLEPRRR